MSAPSTLSMGSPVPSTKILFLLFLVIEEIRSDPDHLQLKDITGETATGSLDDTTTEEATMVIEMECTDDQSQMTDTQEDVKRLKTLLAQKEKKKKNYLREKIQTLQVSNKLTPETVNNSTVPNYFYYCTGFTYDEFNKLCTFFRLPDNETAPQTHTPLIYKKVERQIQQMPLCQQFLLVLMKLRQNLDLKELAFKVQTDVHSVSTLFNSWVDFIYGRLGQLSIWPHRDNITESMPDNYKTDFPTTFAILDCTELKIEKPSSLLQQSLLL